MRTGSQVNAIVEQALNSAIFALEAVIVSVGEGRATVRPTPKRSFGDNPEPVAYSVVENVRLISLVWDGGKSGIGGRVLPGDECLLIALSHGDGDEPDHKTFSNAVALCGFSDKSIHQMPDSAFSVAAPSSNGMTGALKVIPDRAQPLPLRATK